MELIPVHFRREEECDGNNDPEYDFSELVKTEWEISGKNQTDQINGKDGYDEEEIGCISGFH